MIFIVPALQKTFLNLLFEFAWGFRIQTAGDYLLVKPQSPIPVKQGTINFQNVRDIRCTFLGKLGKKPVDQR